MPRGAPDFYKVTREKGVETRVYYEAYTLDPLTWATLLDLKGVDITLEALEFSTPYEYNYLVIEPYKADGTLDKPMRILRKDGTAPLLDITPKNVHDHESICWFELIYDTANNWYKFGLGYSLRFANGLRIRVYNAYTLEGRISIYAQLLIRG